MKLKNKENEELGLTEEDIKQLMKIKEANENVIGPNQICGRTNSPSKE